MNGQFLNLSDCQFSLLDELPNPIWIEDAKQDRVFYNQAWCEFTGRSLDEEIAEDWHGGMHPEDMHRVGAIYQKAFASHQPFQMEYRYLRKDGTYRWLLDVGKPLFQPDGSFIGFHGSCNDITEWKQAEEELRKSHQLLKQTFDSLGEAVFVIDPKPRTIIKVNRAFERIFGYSEPEVTGKNTQFLHANQDSYERFGRELFPALDKEGIFHVQYPMRRKDGELIVCEITVSEVRDVAGERSLVISVIRDITEEMWAVIALRESEERFRFASQCTSDIIVEWYPEKDDTRYYGRFDDLLGYEPGEIQKNSETISAMIHPEDRNRVIMAARKSLESGEPFEEEYRIQRKDGRYLIWLGRGRFVTDQHGVPYKFLGVASDITVRRQIEKSLHDSEERYRKLIELSPDAIYVQCDGRFAFINPAGLRLFGAEHPDQIVGNPVLERMHPDYRQTVKDRIQQLNEEEKSVPPLEEKYLRLDGTAIDVEVRAVPFILDGKPGALVLSRDITERQRAQEALRNSEERFRSILENSLDLAYRRNLQTDYYDYMSPVVEQILGFNVVEMSALPIQEVLMRIHPDDRASVEVDIACAAETGKAKAIYRFLAKEGKYRWLADYITVQKDAQGKPLYRDGILRDITDLKEAELSLQESEERYRTLFEESPVSLWEENLSEVKAYLDHLLDSGVTDLVSEFDHHPEHILNCINKIIILGINTATFILYQAENKEDILKNFNKVIGPDAIEVNKDSVLAIAQGKTHFKRELINHKLSGEAFYAVLEWAVLPGFEEDYSRVLVTITDITEHKQAEERMRQSAARAEALARVAERINANLDLNTMLNTICEEVARALHLPAASVLLYDEQKDVLQAKTTYGVPPGFLARYHEIPRVYLEELERQLSPVIVIPDVQSILTLPNPILYADFDIRMVAGTRITFDEKLIGVLLVNSFHTPRGLSEDERILLQAFANQAAVAIQNARMFDKLNSRAKELEALAIISSSLGQAETLVEMLPILVEKTQEIFAADNVTLIIQKGQRLEIAAGRGKNQCRIGEQYSPESFWKTLLEGGSLFFMDNAELERLLTRSSSTDLIDRITDEASCALIPLKTGHASIGLLHVGFQSAHHFMEDEQHLLVALSEMASNAIQRAGIMDTLERRVADRTRELDTLYRVASVASASLTLKEILEQSLNFILRSAGAISGAIHLVGTGDDSAASLNEDAPDPFKLHLMAEIGLQEEYASALNSIPFGHGLAGKVAQKNEALVISDIASDPRAAYPQYFVDTPMSFIGLPIRRSEKVIGVMSILGQTSRQISAEDVALLTTISDQLGVVIENARLHQQAELGAVAAERQRLARELHDSITQVLYSLSLFAGAGKNIALAGDREKLQNYFQKIETSAQQALKEMRLMIYELRPSVLEEEGLVTALRRRLDAVEGRAGIISNLLVEGDINIPTNLESELYWVAQEGLNNTLKHAKASSVTVQILSDEEKVILEIVDDGMGFNLEQVKDGGGFGLNNLRERAKKIGGKLSISSSSSKGTRVRLEVQR